MKSFGCDLKPEPQLEVPICHLKFCSPFEVAICDLKPDLPRYKAAIPPVAHVVASHLETPLSKLL